MNENFGFIPSLQTTQGLAANIGKATSADATVSYTADANGGKFIIDKFLGGYDGAPQAGATLKIIGGADGNTLVGQTPITNSGPAPIDVLIEGFPNQGIKAVLTNGGPGVTGYVWLKTRFIQGNQ